MPTCRVPPSKPTARLPTTTPTTISISATEIPVRIEIKLASSASPIQTAAMNQMLSSIKNSFRLEGVISSRGFLSPWRQKANSIALAKSTASLAYINQTFTDFRFDSSSFVIRISSFSSHLEAFAQVKLTADGIVDKEVFCAFTLDAAIVNQIGAVHDGESLTHVVVGNHDCEPRFAQVDNDLLHVVHGNGINAAEWLVEHQELRLCHQRSGYGQASFLPAAQR